jgi:hypothetical protein
MLSQVDIILQRTELFTLSLNPPLQSPCAIELVVSHTAHSESPLWQERRIMKCTREWTGGQPVQNKSGTKGKDRKIPSKKSGCQCQLTIKLY